MTTIGPVQFQVIVVAGQAQLRVVSGQARLQVVAGVALLNVVAGLARLQVVTGQAWLQVFIAQPQVPSPSSTAKDNQFHGLASAVSFQPLGSSNGSTMLLGSTLGYPVISSTLVCGSLSFTSCFWPISSTKT